MWAGTPSLVPLRQFREEPHPCRNSFLGCNPGKSRIGLLIAEPEHAGNLGELGPQGLFPSVRTDHGDSGQDRPGQGERDGCVEWPHRPCEEASAIDDDPLVEEVPEHPSADGPS